MFFLFKRQIKSIFVACFKQLSWKPARFPFSKYNQHHALVMWPSFGHVIAMQPVPPPLKMKRIDSRGFGLLERKKVNVKHSHIGGLSWQSSWSLSPIHPLFHSVFFQNIDRHDLMSFRCAATPSGVPKNSLRRLSRLFLAGCLAVDKMSIKSFVKIMQPKPPFYGKRTEFQGLRRLWDGIFPLPTLSLFWSRKGKHFFRDL